MKTAIVSILVFSTFSISAQDSKITVSPSPKAIKKEQPNSVSSEGIQQGKTTSSGDASYPMTVSYSREDKSKTVSPRTITDIETDILNIKAKMDYVKTNPEMDAKARAEGWYDRNEILLKNLEEEKSNLLKK